MPKKNRPADLTVELDEDPSSEENPYYDMYCKSRSPVLVVHVGEHIIETTATSDESTAANWIRSALKETRRKRSGPMIISLCAFKGLPCSAWNLKGPKANPNHADNPYKVISVCVAGQKVLFYRDECYVNEVPSIKPLWDLLEDRKVVVVGHQIKEIAKKLDSQWGVKIAQPVDIRKLAANAYGKDAVYWPTKQNGRVVMEQLSMEELSELVLDGLVLEKKPGKIMDQNWAEGGYFGRHTEMAEQRIMYASRDAFLCYEIGAKCIDIHGWSAL